MCDKRNALKCKYANYAIIQDTILSFRCLNARFRYEYQPGMIADLGALAISECETCKIGNAPIIPKEQLERLITQTREWTL